jgi:hypothetical protein
LRRKERCSALLAENPDEEYNRTWANFRGFL